MPRDRNDWLKPMPEDTSADGPLVDKLVVRRDVLRLIGIAAGLSAGGALVSGCSSSSGEWHGGYGNGACECHNVGTCACNRVCECNRVAARGEETGTDQQIWAVVPMPA